MNLGDGWGSVVSFKLISDSLVLFRKDSKNRFELILKIKGLTKKSKLIKSGSEALNILINRF